MDNLEELPPIGGGPQRIQSAFDFSFPSNVLPDEETQDAGSALEAAVHANRQSEIRSLVSSGTLSDKAILRQVFSALRSGRRNAFKALVESWSNTGGFAQHSQTVKNLCISLHLSGFYDIVRRVDEVSTQDYLLAAKKGNFQLVEMITLVLRAEGKLDSSLQKKALQLATREGNEEVLDVLLTQ
jgi:hypothetical protein